MDLIKIGKYIAEKRKALGLTQKQLAEKLNMSDKSVSKWERGISSPPLQYYSFSHEQNSTYSVFMQVCKAWQPLLSLQIYSNNQLQMV